MTIPKSLIPGTTSLTKGIAPPCTGRTDIPLALRLPAEQRQAGK